MIAIDTNILVRLLLGDEPQSQVHAAQKIFARTQLGEKIFISAFVLLETAWVLKNKGRTHIEIAEALEMVANTDGIFVSLKTAVLEGLARMKNAPAGIGLADCFILADSASHDSLPLLTFDQALRNSEPVRTSNPSD